MHLIPNQIIGKNICQNRNRLVPYNELTVFVTATLQQRLIIFEIEIVTIHFFPEYNHTIMALRHLLDHPLLFFMQLYQPHHLLLVSLLRNQTSQFTHLLPHLHEIIIIVTKYYLTHKYRLFKTLSLTKYHPISFTATLLPFLSQLRTYSIYYLRIAL